MQVTKETYNSINKFLNKYRLSRTIHEDLAQEIAIKLWSKARVDGAIHKVVQNTVFDYFRALRVARRMPQEELTNLTDGYIVRMPEHESSYIISISKCSPKEKEILSKMYVQGYKLSEIAKQLGIPLNTVKASLGRALNKLRRQIKHEYN